MTKLDKTQFAQFLTANGFEVKFEDGWGGEILNATVETARGTLQVLACESRVFAYKPNGKRAEYYEVSNAQANARVRQLLKANATARC